eukprot:s556_g19.t1
MELARFPAGSPELEAAKRGKKVGLPATVLALSRSFVDLGLSLVSDVFLLLDDPYMRCMSPCLINEINYIIL